MSRRINSFHLEGVFGHVSFDTFTGGADGHYETTKDFCPRKPVHEDLLEALRAFRIHAAVLTDHGDYTAYEEKPDLLDIFNIDTVNATHSNEFMSLALKGEKKLKQSGYMPLVVNKMVFDHEHSTYQYLENYHEAANNFFAEVDQYLSGKIGDEAQFSMFDQAGAPTPEGLADTPAPERKKKGKKSRKSVDDAINEMMPEGVVLSGHLPPVEDVD